MKVVGVKVNGSNKTVYYNDNDLNLKINLTVIVNTERGLQFGTVTEFLDDENFDKYEDVIRIASKKDYLQHLKNQEDEKKALEKCKELIVKNGLNMTVIDANYNFDKSQLLFRFVSDERVDFRQLAKELGAKLRTRIELRQIGVRDKAKEIGGLGPCGRFLCCNTFLTSFDTVSISMAKNQGLALNPTKLMVYVEDFYVVLIMKMMNMLKQRKVFLMLVRKLLLKVKRVKLFHLILFKVNIEF